MLTTVLAGATIGLYLVSPELELVPQHWQPPIILETSPEDCELLASEDNRYKPKLQAGEYFWKTECSTHRTIAVIKRVRVANVNGSMQVIDDVVPPALQARSLRVEMFRMQCDVMQMAGAARSYVAEDEDLRLWRVEECEDVASTSGTN